MTPSSNRSLAAWLGAVAVTALAVTGVATIGINHEPVTVADGTAAQVAPAPEEGADEAPSSGADPAAAATQVAGQPALSPQSSPWPPGTTFHLTSEYPEAGVPFNATECTAAMSFDGGNGRLYAVTASHCGHVGDLIWPADGATIADYTEELGQIVYSGLDAPADSETERGVDVAIIEIYNPTRPMVMGAEPPESTVLADYPADLNGEVCKIGGTTGETCGVAGPRDERYVMVDPVTSAEVRTTGDTAYLCAQRGDSGGPVTATVAGREVVIGLVSGTRSDAAALGEAESLSQCQGDGVDSAAGAVAYATAGQIRQVIEEVVPDARLNPVELS